MHFNLSIIMANLAGSLAAIIETPTDPLYYAPIGAALVNDPALDVEQVGFLCPPLYGGDVRLEMCGSEFSSNAARGAAFIAGSRLGRKIGDTIQAEVSGCPSLLSVEFREDGPWIDMPLAFSIEALEVPIAGRHWPASFPTIHLDGITHVIALDEAPNRELADDIIHIISRNTDAEAAGVMFLNGSDMHPYVWVRSTGYRVWEGSCCSGTLAAAIWLSLDSEDSPFRAELRQPGGVLSAELSKVGSDIIGARIGGPVSIRPAAEYHLDI